MALSPIDRRIAAQFHQRQIEIVTRVESTGEMIESRNEAPERQILSIARRAVKRGHFTRADQARIVDILTRLPTENNNRIERAFRSAIKWSYDDAIERLVDAIPRIWWRGIMPLLPERKQASKRITRDYNAWLRRYLNVSITHDITDEADVLLAKVDELTDAEYTEMIKQLLFEPLSTETVERLLFSPNPVTGQSWQEHMIGLSKKITEPSAVANSMVTGLTQGETLDQIMKRVDEHIGKLNGSSRRVVRTEGRRLIEMASRETWDDISDLMVGAQIQETLDAVTRPEHADRHGTIYYNDGRQPPLSEMPVLPDQANCRGYSAPVLKTPEEIETNPEVSAAFHNVKHDEIPDPTTYSRWFAKATVEQRKLAVGATRYRTLVDKLGGVTPEWTEFVDKKGKLMSVKALKAEKPAAREVRKGQVNELIQHREKAIIDVATLGFQS